MKTVVPQFSLFALMKGVAAVAVVATLATMPAQVAAPLVLVITLLITPHILLRTWRGDRLERAFCVGLLVPLAGLIILAIGYMHAYVLFNANRQSYVEAIASALRRMPLLRTHALATWGFGLLSGAISWFVAWQEERRAANPSRHPSFTQAPAARKPPRAIARIIFEFAGGPLDGKTVVGDLGDAGEADRYYGLTDRGRVGEAFGVAWDYASETADTKTATPDEPPPNHRHHYQVSDRLEGDGEVLIRAEYRARHVGDTNLLEGE